MGGIEENENNAMLIQLAPNLWHLQRGFKTAGLPMTSRMTVVRFADGRLWIHSPVSFGDDVHAQLTELGEVAWIVAPNCYHHLFAKACQRAFPNARLYGAPKLAAKRPDLAGMHTLGPTIEAAWADELEQMLVGGMPLLNELVWFHKASGTLIATDVLQWLRGGLPLPAVLFAHLMGVRKRLAVSRTVRLATRDKAAAADSARAILRWPFTRVVMAHNAVIEQDAHAEVERAFAWFSA